MYMYCSHNYHNTVPAVTRSYWRHVSTHLLSHPVPGVFAATPGPWGTCCHTRSLHHLLITCTRASCAYYRISQFVFELEEFLGNETEVNTVVNLLEDLNTLQQLSESAANGTLNCKLVSF